MPLNRHRSLTRNLNRDSSLIGPSGLRAWDSLEVVAEELRAGELPPAACGRPGPGISSSWVTTAAAAQQLRSGTVTQASHGTPGAGPPARAW